jgi:hypothetical protein
MAIAAERSIFIHEIVENKEGLYEGDLAQYFGALFFQAENVNSPYHNFRHMSHVFWLCYQASIFYNDTLTKREKRNLLIAALFHDFDHLGRFGSDDINIERSLRALKKHICPEDIPHENSIGSLIKITEYPYKVPSDNIDMMGKILRDADVSQALNVAWIQQVVFGLAAEWNKAPMEVLRMQRGFHQNLIFHTEWARTRFPREEIDRKIAEAEGLIETLEKYKQKLKS